MLPFLPGAKQRGVSTPAYSENVRQALESKRLWEMNEELMAMVRGERQAREQKHIQFDPEMPRILDTRPPPRVLRGLSRARHAAFLPHSFHLVRAPAPGSSVPQIFGQRQR